MTHKKKNYNLLIRHGTLKGAKFIPLTFLDIKYSKSLVTVNHTIRYKAGLSH